MDAIFKKMNYKYQESILVINAPQSFEENIDGVKEWATIHRSVEDIDKIDYAIVFVKKQEEIDATMPSIVEKIEGDALIWYCYPKKSSKKYKCDFNRDTGWEIMGKHGFEGVRMVAVDKDWSALRFRNVKYIKKITRRKSMALSKEAKERTTNKR